MSNEIQQNVFDYNNLPLANAIELKNSAERVKVRLKRTSEDVFEIGKELIAAKALCGHGNFEKWIKTEFDMTKMSANRFINVYEQLGDKSNTMLLFNPTALYLLASPSTPEPIIEQVLQDAENGIIRTPKEIQQLKQQAKEEEVKPASGLFTRKVTKEDVATDESFDNFLNKKPDINQNQDEDDIPENPHITQQIKDTEERIAKHDKYLRNVFWVNFETRLEKIMDDYKDSKDSIQAGEMPDSAKKTLAKFSLLFKN